MKRATILGVLLLLATIAFAADETPVPEPTQDPDAPYRLFRTLNIYTLLKLDTRTGQIWQVQWGDENHRFTVPLSTAILLSASTKEHPTIAKPGRFTLCPTENIYTFVLLDQEDGRTWQIQWGDEKKRLIWVIE